MNVEYFKDPDYRRGIDIACANYRLDKFFRGNVYFSGERDQQPWWVGAQHFSRYEIIGTEPCMKNGMFGYHNDGKSLAVYQDVDGHEVIHLEVFGDREYVPGEKRGNWPHLLIGGEFLEQTPVRIHTYRSLTYSMGVRIVYCDNKMTPEEYDPVKHCAQTTAYLTLQNIDRMSPAFGEFIWFGIPIFDSRHDFPAPFRIIDGDPEDNAERGATGAIIYVLGGEDFLQKYYSGVNPAAGEWAGLSIDILPYAREALKAAQEKGLMRRTSFEQLGVGSFNIGWEVTGVFNCAMELKNIQLTGMVDD